MGLRKWLNKRDPASIPRLPVPVPQPVPGGSPAAVSYAGYPAPPVALPAPSPVPIPLPPLSEPQALQSAPTPVGPVPPTPGLHFTQDPRWQIPGATTTSWAVWVPPGQPIRLESALVRGGAIYVGPALTAAQGFHQGEPSLIDPSLPVNFAQPDWAGECLKYWPSYHQLTPEGRAAFLSWLSWGREAPTMPIGYVFLYLYGLERRSLVDATRSPVAQGELPWILSEVERLLKIYGTTGSSFTGYGSKLASLLRFLIHGAPTEPPPEAPKGWELPLDVKAGLGQLVSAGRPLPPEWALTWVRAHPDFYFRTPAHRCPEEFADLFSLRYREKYGEGMVVNPSKHFLTLSYHPASQGVPFVTIPLSQICDVGMLTAAVKKLAALATECTDALDSYSRWLGRHPEGRGSLPALALLPPVLMENRPASPELLALIEWCERVLRSSDEAVTEDGGLIAQWPSASGKLTKADSGEFARLLEVKGYGIEPDVRYGGPPLHSGLVALFRLSGEHPADGDAAWITAAPLLQLAGSVIASIQANSAALEAITKALCHDLGLPVTAESRVHAHLHWASSVQKLPTIVKRMFDGMDQSSREQYGRLLIDLAARYSQIGPAQVTALTSAYEMLGLAPASVYSLIHDRTSAHTAADLVTVRPKRPAAAGETIPPPPPSEGPATSESSGHVVLDEDVIARRLADSAQAAALLGSVFVDDDTAPAHTPETGVSDANAELLRQLSTQTTWTRAEFDSLATALGLLPNGALESLNDAAFETCGESLLEGGDVLEINPDVLQELL